MPDDKVEKKVEEEEKVEEKVEKVDKEEEEDESIISDEDKSIIALLKNPTTAPATIQALAKQYGLKLGETPTKQVEKTIANELREALGDQWDFLSEKLGPIIEKQVKDAEDRVRGELGDRDRKTTKSTFEKAERNFFQDNPDAKAYRKRMGTLSGRYPPQEDADPEEYFNDLHILASGRKSSITDTIEQKRSARIAKNRGAGDLETKSSSKESGEPKTMTLEESISSALKTVNNEAD